MGGGGLGLGSSVSKIISDRLWLEPVLLDTVSSILSSLYLLDDAKIDLLFLIFSVVWPVDVTERLRFGLDLTSVKSESFSLESENTSFDTLCRSVRGRKIRFRVFLFPFIGVLFELGIPRNRNAKQRIRQPPAACR
ncbi:unnamed protein product [Macrosiphum euphorbiae]|uniref:Uncharacterized protein n=1 Tax=Macrosiphum euphorbiae TaxID=13131 RepID=A0AAV0WPP5_9HEMI|nr:unnamed protein product [Macrosiphum euphorbiae]